MDKTSKPGIYRRNKRYVFVLPYVDADGRRKQKWVGGFETLAAADKERARLRYRRDSGLEVNPEKLTLAAFGIRWLAYKKPQLAANTYAAYEDAFKRANPIIGTVLLTNVSKLRMPVDRDGRERQRLKTITRMWFHHQRCQA